MARSWLKKRIHREEENSDSIEQHLETVLNPTSVLSEDYRSLRANLLHAWVDTPPKVVMITSPGPSEGKSTVCANLGVVLSQANKSTLVMDCDLRRPMQHRIFKVRNFVGMVDVLTGERDLSEAWQEIMSGLKLMPSGSMSPNPAELLGSKRFAQLIGQVREQFDYVLIDSSPTELVSDSVVLANQVDGALIVIDAQQTRKVAVRQSIRSLETVGGRVIGTVMNKVKAPKRGYYNRYYRYEPDEQTR